MAAKIFIALQIAWLCWYKYSSRAPFFTLKNLEEKINLNNNRSKNFQLRYYLLQRDNDYYTTAMLTIPAIFNQAAYFDERMMFSLEKFDMIKKNTFYDNNSCWCKVDF